MIVIHLSRLDQGDPYGLSDSPVRILHADPDVGLGDPDHLPPEVRNDLAGVGAGRGIRHRAVPDPAGGTDEAGGCIEVSMKRPLIHK